MTRIQTEDELRQRVRASTGFIYNDFVRTGPSRSEFNVLHTAGCQFLDAASLSVPKYFFEEFAAARAWLYKERGSEGVGWKRCEVCEPIW
jgi:hypothetical protein